jgi:hypothetical protein
VDGRDKHGHDEFLVATGQFQPFLLNRTLVGLTRASIFFATRVLTKMMDCRIESSNDDRFWIER